MKYHDAREWLNWIKAAGEVAGVGPDRQHQFAMFFAHSDWDDERAAWTEFTTSQVDVEDTDGPR